MQQINKNIAHASSMNLKNIEVQIQRVEAISETLSSGTRRISFHRMLMIGQAETLLFQLENYEDRLSIALDQIHQVLEHLYH